MRPTLSLTAERDTAPALNPRELGALLQLASPGLPVGAFSYSSGLEAAVEHGLVTDAASALDWIRAGLCDVLGNGEVPLLARLRVAWRNGSYPCVLHWNGWHLASRETVELRAETEQMGWSLVQVIEHLTWGSPENRARLRAMRPVGFVCAFAFAAAALNLGPEAATTAFCFSWLENQVMAAIKAVPLGQAAGQQILYRLTKEIPGVIARASTLADDEVSSFAPQLTVLSSRHASQYSRIFRS
ncbi:MAG TPA: urease accessory protein UreF [Chthoniobacterales bacterium]